ncbi:GNAT family N-acetyltransferase [Compostimonas suwonensis]|uniref:FR47-like protein n=1 Tax=Compostimonas suwonensis TaxID=1048394 RepID=A0A2M9C4F8_9MICO|nr:GNAT family N-acetyltransferase [Compostimonas suwonensis]PJJ65406.1 FR47-like protein [Compostimonas suwonensis]
MITSAFLDSLADEAWPGLDTVRIDGWLLRAAEGVTRRSNSVLPAGPVGDAEAAIARVEGEYARRGIRPAFQLSDAAVPPGLAELLAARGYEPQGTTATQTADAAAVLSAIGEAAPPTGFAVRVAGEPDAAWLELWWSVDGRGGGHELDVARRILLSCPALYASVLDERGATVAVARLALVERGGERGGSDGGRGGDDGRARERWGGLYALAVAPAHRRRGLAGVVIGALTTEARAAGVERLWLQVAVDNAPALALYGRLGFATVSGYRYWCAPDGLDR